MKEIIRFTTLDSICCALKCQSEDVLRNENSREVTHIPNIQWFKQYLPTISDFNVFFRFWRPIAFKRYTAPIAIVLTHWPALNFQISKVFRLLLLSLITWANLRFKLKVHLKQKVNYIRKFYEWTTSIPILAFLLYFPVILMTISSFKYLGILLIFCVLSAVHHSEIVAHRVGEPYGTIILAVSITIIGLYYCFANDYRGEQYASLQETLYIQL